MKITKSHVDFWAYKKAPKCLQSKVVKVDIDTLIPYDRPDKFYNGCLEPHNTLVILRMARKRETIPSILSRLLTSPDCNKKRRAFCKKWLCKVLSK